MLSFALLLAGILSFSSTYVTIREGVEPSLELYQALRNQFIAYFPIRIHPILMDYIVIGGGFGLGGILNIAVWGDLYEADEDRPMSGFMAFALVIALWPLYVIVLPVWLLIAYFKNDADHKDWVAVATICFPIFLAVIILFLAIDFQRLNVGT